MKIPLEPGQFYHIYNHANGHENLFVNEGNYYFFLRKFMQYIHPIADTFAYCLMPNHFHIAIKIKSKKELLKIPGIEKYATISAFLSKQFAKLFSSYTQAFNKQQSRRGSLFVPNFSRKRIESPDYFRALIHYIHFNAVHHGFVDDLRDWPYSSFNSFFSPKSSSLKRAEVISWFEDKKSFFRYHQKQIDEKMVLELEVND